MMVKAATAARTIPRPKVCMSINAVYMTNDSDDAENPRLDDSNGMQQRADRSGRNHCTRQPGMDRHPGGLGESEQKAEKNDLQGEFRGGVQGRF